MHLTPGLEHCLSSRFLQVPGASSFLTSLSLFRYIEAIRRLKAEGKRFPRTVHMTFVPGK